MRLILLISSAICICSTNCMAQFWQPTGSVNSTQAITSFVNGSLGDVVYSSGNNGVVYNSFSFSEDEGENWTHVGSVLEQGAVGQYESVGNRLYAAVSLVNGDYEYHYSTDNGYNWEVDTVGLPHFYGISSYAKDAFRIKKMGENHLVAFNGLVINGAYIKTIGETAWTESFPSSSNSHLDFTYQGNNWYALNPPSEINQLVVSTDQGATWTGVTMNGLTPEFIPSIIESNHTNKLYLASGTSDHIYFSTDGGQNWTLTNAGEIYDYPTAWVSKLHAVDDYVFASIAPDNPVTDLLPKYVVSNSAVPAFEAGDVSGLNESVYVFPILSCLHTSSKFFIHWEDLHTSEPGFDGTVHLNEREIATIRIYPNPCSDVLRFTPNSEHWSIISLSGKVMDRGVSAGQEQKVLTNHLAPGMYLLKNGEVTERFIKE